MGAWLSFASAAARWQTFYVLVGSASATLVGLMFVAVTFGSNLVKPETAETARSFIDPSFRHFVQVLFTACLAVIPGLAPWLLGLSLVGVGVLRGGGLVRTYRHMRLAHRANNDVELSDWISAIVVPALCHALLLATGVGFVVGWEAAFDALAIVTIVILMVGVFGAWELILWMVLTRARAP
jgi:hypothetical protein